MIGLRKEYNTKNKQKQEREHENKGTTIRQA